MDPHKRSFDGGDEYGAKRSRTSYADNPVSKVLHVRNVDPAAQEELISVVSQVGTVVAIKFLSQYNQALIELDSIQAASAFILYSQGTPIFVGGKEARFSYSKSQSINAAAGGGAGVGAGISAGISATGAPVDPAAAAAGVSSILLCTIVNPLYNINVDVIHAIMSPYGTVLRIVIFSKNGVQALIEFDSPMAAVQAKAALEGKDIYAGSCTLKIEFSKTTKLNVRSNTDKTRDYTGSVVSSAPPMHAPPALGGFTYPYGAEVYPPQPQSGVGQQGRTVLMVYGLHESLDADKIFNLFCLYGNVQKMKMLPAGKGTMVQMSDNQGADSVLNNLNFAYVRGKQIQIQHSKHPYIADSRQDASADPSTTSVTKDFHDSPMNRFSRPTAYKHVYKPSQTIYFSNAPKEYTQESFAELCTSNGLAPPTQVKFFALPTTTAPGKEPSERKIGLLEFSDTATAVEVILTLNNTLINGHTLKLAFSQNAINSNAQTQAQIPPPAAAGVPAAYYGL